MKRPLISILIPTYNRPDFLCELLESIAGQGYPHLQTIIVNDCGEAIDFIVELYPELNIQVVEMERNQKHVHARNAGLRHAQGELIMLCDDDDLILPGHLERMLTALEGYDLVYTDVETFDYRVEGKVRIPISRRLFAYEYDLEEMKRFSTFVSSGCLYRRNIHDTIGPFDEEMYHYWDWDFFLNVAASFRVKRLPVASALYAFSDHGDNISGNHEDMRPYLDLLSAKHQLGYLPTKNFFLLLEEPEVKKREATSQIVWDGQPVISRRMTKREER